VEGMNIGAMLLGSLGVLVLGVAILVALGLSVAGKYRAALLTFAGGLLATAITAALATLSFLQKGGGYYVEGSEPLIALVTVATLLAGTGQFVAAVRRSGYGIAILCAVGSTLFLAAPVGGADALRWIGGTPRVFGVSSLSLPWLNLGLAISVFLAAASMAVAILPPQRQIGALVGIALAAIGSIAGFAAGDVCVETHATHLHSIPGNVQEVRVEVDVLGRRVSDEVGFAPIPREGLALVRAVSLRQVAWVFGPPVLGAGAGLLVASGLAKSLTRWRHVG
jgi:hypothetical protein